MKHFRFFFILEIVLVLYMRYTITYKLKIQITHIAKFLYSVPEKKLFYTSNSLKIIKYQLFININITFTPGQFLMKDKLFWVNIKTTLKQVLVIFLTFSYKASWNPSHKSTVMYQQYLFCWFNKTFDESLLNECNDIILVFHRLQTCRTYSDWKITIFLLTFYLSFKTKTNKKFMF